MQVKHKVLIIYAEHDKIIPKKLQVVNFLTVSFSMGPITLRMLKLGLHCGFGLFMIIAEAAL